jgi:hypothetical protein
MRGQQGLAQTDAIVQHSLVTTCDDMGMEMNEGWSEYGADDSHQEFC